MHRQAITFHDFSGCADLGPFKRMDVPPYREFSEKGCPWRLGFQSLPTIYRGYYKGLQVISRAFRSPYLRENGKLWMSITPMELESQAHMAHAAKGRVVMLGLGMGTLLYNLANKPEVDVVHVVERDVKLYYAFLRFARFEEWGNASKVRFHFGDAKDVGTYDKIRLRPVDCLVGDIWEKLGDPVAQADMAAINAVLNAGSVGWWGMELDFVDYARQRGIRPVRFTREQWDEWVESTGLPVYSWEGCETMALEAGLNVALS